MQLLVFIISTWLGVSSVSHRKEMVLRALSATARACSIWVAWR